MTKNGVDDRTPERDALRCPDCGRPHAAGDRFCAHCGATLSASPSRETTREAWAAADGGGAAAAANPAPGAGIAAASPVPAAAPQESSLWLLSARPRAVFIGGLLLLLLAVVLLLVGQLDWTGTLVMLAICATALGLFTIVIGVLRVLWNAAGRG